MSAPRRLRVVGPGRAGGAFALALGAAGWQLEESLRRGDSFRDATTGADLVLVATPDAAVAEVAAAMEPRDITVVAHVSGSLGLDVLAPHPRVASVHPLVALPTAELGAERLRGAWFAVAGDDVAREVVAALDGRAIDVDDEVRALYHAAACIASNHVVALLGQVERIANEIGVPLEAYLDLVRATIDNVDELGPAAALTGPAARGDWDTIQRHRAALLSFDATELVAYDALVEQARRLVE